MPKVERERERERTLGFWFGILGFLRVFSLFNIVLGWFLCLPQLKISKFDFCDAVFGCQESSRKVEKVTMVGLFEMLGWAASYCTEAQVFWVGELGSVQLQLTLVQLVHKLCPFFCWNFDHMPMAGVAITTKLQWGNNKGNTVR